MADVFSPLGTNERFSAALTAVEALISGLCESSGPRNHNLLVSLCTHTLIADMQAMSRAASFPFKRSTSRTLAQVKDSHLNV